MRRYFAINHSWQTLLKEKSITADLFAGITVAVVALPLCVALAIAAGSTPEKGFLTGLFSAVVVFCLGSSPLQVGSGPTAAFVVLISQILQKEGEVGLAIAMVMAGVLSLVASFLNLGKWVRFIPRAVVLGFSAGIGGIIITSQVKDFLGITLPYIPSSLLEKWSLYIQYFSTFRWENLGVSLLTVFLGMAIKWYFPRWPHYLLAICGGALVVFLGNYSIDTVGSKYGEISYALSLPSFSSIEMEKILAVLPAALSIFFIANLEGLLSVLWIERVAQKKTDPNCELRAYGATNLLLGIFGLLPGTAAITRCVTNVKAGAETRLSVFFYIICFLLLGFLAKGCVAYVPMASLAGVLSMVAVSMVDFGEIRKISRLSRLEGLLVGITFLLTLSVDLAVAVITGILLSALFFMYKVAQSTLFELRQEEGTFSTEVISLKGPLFFGVLEEFTALLCSLKTPSKECIFKLEGVSYMDSHAAQIFLEKAKEWEQKGVKIVIKGLQNQPRKMLERLGCNF